MDRKTLFSLVDKASLNFSCFLCSDEGGTDKEMDLTHG